ncbi:MAG: hypothetical protein K5662_04745 [Lachnospiraceae bacterium]|nr:hypothetical protein [Lachnospiraceae bacterium]
MDDNKEKKTKKTEKQDIETDKKRVPAFFADAGRGAAKLAENAKKSFVKVLDANDDGKFDLKDLSVVANQLGEKIENERQKKEYNSLKPIFEEGVSAPEFILPKIVRVAEIDKKHAAAESCNNSIGFNAEYEDIQIVTIYPRWTKLFSLEFYPNENGELFYVDPCDRDRYIALDQYFYYLRVAKVGELQMIAQSLGAKHFKVTYVEQEKLTQKRKLRPLRK